MNGETMSDFENIIGRKIIGFRYLSQEELDEMDWYGRVPVILLDDGTEIVASQDDEGNGPGRFFIDNPTVST